MYPFPPNFAPIFSLESVDGRSKEEEEEESGISSLSALDLPRKKSAGGA